MKLKSLLSVSLFALVAAAPLGAVAAMAADADAAKNADRKAVEPHSHLTVKTGIVAKAPEAAPCNVKAKADRDMSKHFHPRDGK